MGKEPIYYDTETTGTRAQIDRIVEIAAYNPVSKKSFQRLINPEIPIPKEASEIHGIDDKMVADAPLFHEVAAEFIEFCAGDVALIAHNNDHFDKLFLAEEGKRHNISFPDWPMIDSLKWARKYRPDLPRHSLQFLREIYGVEENRAHRALDDVMVLYEVFSQMIDDLPIDIVIDLLIATHEPVTEVMPFGKHQGKPLGDVPPHYVSWLNKQGVFDKKENASLKSAFEKLQLLPPPK